MIAHGRDVVTEGRGPPSSTSRLRGTSAANLDESGPGKVFGRVAAGVGACVMVAIVGPPPFCIDNREVTVAEYRRCAACGPAKEAYRTGATFTAAAQKAQTANCTNTRTGLDNYPINCVSYQDATTYCAGV